MERNATDLEIISAMQAALDDREKLINHLIAKAKNADDMLRAEKERMDKAVQLIADHTGQSMLLVSCAWCNEPLSVKDGLGTTGVSHGICHDCRKEMVS